jgi:hypothetical protein
MHSNEKNSLSSSSGNDMKRDFEMGNYVPFLWNMEFFVYWCQKFLRKLIFPHKQMKTVVPVTRLLGSI